MKLDTAIASWVAVLQYQRAPETVERYSIWLADFAAFVGGRGAKDPDVAELDADVMHAYMAHTTSRPPKHREGTLAPGTIKNCYATLCGFFKFLERRKLVPTNPMIEVVLPSLPQKAKGEYQYLEPDQLERLFLYARDGMPGEDHRQRRPHWRRNEDALLVALLGWCGLRVSEACNLDTTSIQGDELRVVGKGSKERVLPIVEPYLIEALDEHSSPGGASGEGGMHLLGMARNRRKRLTRGSAEVRINQLAKQAGLGHVHCHMLRHSFGTELARAVPDDPTVLRDAMGHQSTSTSELYRHSNSTARRAALERAAAARRS